MFHLLYVVFGEIKFQNNSKLNQRRYTLSGYQLDTDCTLVQLMLVKMHQLDFFQLRELFLTRTKYKNKRHALGTIPYLVYVFKFIYWKIYKLKLFNQWKIRISARELLECRTSCFGGQTTSDNVTCSLMKGQWNFQHNSLVLLYPYVR